MRELIIEDIKDMEDLHCYNYYEEDEDYSERDEIKREVQDKITSSSEEYEYGIDHLMFTVNGKKYMFYVCDEFVNMSISLKEKVLINTKNPNEIIEFVKTLI